jgi:hypothetical protein
LVIDGEGISKFWKMNAITNRPAASIAQMELSASSGVSVGSWMAVAGGGGAVPGWGGGVVAPPPEFNLLDVLNAVRLPHVSDSTVSVPG